MISVHARVAFVGIVLSAIVVIWLPGLMLYVHHRDIPRATLLKIRASNDARYNKFREESLTQDVIPPNKTSIVWDRIKSTYELFKQFCSHPNILQNYEEQCQSMNDVERIRHNVCRAEWMHLLFKGKVIAVESMMGFAYGKRAGFVIRFEDGRKAMYKPCSGGAEWPENEIRSSHLDYAIGFNRSPPSVMRNISVSLIRSTLDIFDPSYHQKSVVLDQMNEFCAFDGVFMGAMIGWVRDLHSTETIPKRKTSLPLLIDLANTEYVKEVVQSHIFFYLIGLMRESGKNEFVVPSGEVMSVDLDRANFESSSPTVTICYLCKFGQSTVNLLEDAYYKDGLKIALQHSLHYDPLKIFISDNEFKKIKKRLKTILTKCLQKCLDNSPNRESVILL